MALPAILQEESLTRLLGGAAAGAVAVLVISFDWGSWVTGGTAKDMVKKNKSALPLYRHCLSFALTIFDTAPMRQQIS
ncbi:MAG TPA: hypothetical protein VGJ20_33770 [Xanthobacteraceae bacterium]